MTPEFPTYEPGLAAHIMGVVGHDYRCAARHYPESRPMPEWPGRVPLVSAIPMALCVVDYRLAAERKRLAALGASFCGGLVMSDVIESDQYLL